ncbi:MAG: hypothetical protein ACR2KZ_13490 [Segetibacter sp.]
MITKFLTPGIAALAAIYIFYLIPDFSFNALIIAACNPTGLTASTVYTKAAGFETLVNATYSFSRFWYGEQLRWFDLKRTNKLVDRVKALNPDAANYIQPFHIVRPLPQSQIDAVTNKDQFKQNQEYQ